MFPDVSHLANVSTRNIRHTHLCPSGKILYVGTYGYHSRLRNPPANSQVCFRGNNSNPSIIMILMMTLTILRAKNTIHFFFSKSTSPMDMIMGCGTVGFCCSPSTAVLCNPAPKRRIQISMNTAKEPAKGIVPG